MCVFCVDQLEKSLQGIVLFKLRLCYPNPPFSLAKNSSDGTGGLLIERGKH